MDLEEAREGALEQTRIIQLHRKESSDKKLPKDHRIRAGRLVLFYDNMEFLGKLYTRWMGPYRVKTIYSNCSLQLEDL